jgi:hypothetical protein
MAAFDNINILSKNAEMRDKLMAVINGKPIIAQALVETSPHSNTLTHADIIITHVEVNEKHGVGVLTRKIFANSPNIISIRSQNHFGGVQEFGEIDFCIAHTEVCSRADVKVNIARALNGSSVGRIICIPYYADDVLSALAVKELFDVPMCTYIMDDQNVFSSGIPDDLMKELLSKSKLRLAISTELRQEYEMKYNLKFWLLPPIVSHELIQTEARLPDQKSLGAATGVIIGNIWGQRWLELLRRTLSGSGVQIDWYCNSGARWLTSHESELANDGLYAHGALPEETLVPLMRSRYAFAVLPSGTLDETDDRRAIAQLSLPSRVPFILATSNIPIVVLGHSETAAARFIERFQIGAVAEYNPKSFQCAVAYVTSPEVNLAMRRRAAAIAANFSVRGIDEWIWRSLALGEACDSRFEDMLRPMMSSDVMVSASNS